MKLYDVYVVTFENDEEKQVELCGTTYSLVKWTKCFLEWAGHDFNAEYESEEAFLDEVDNGAALVSVNGTFLARRAKLKLK